MFEKVKWFVKDNCGMLAVIGAVGLLSLAIGYGVSGGHIDGFSAFAGKGRS